MKTLPNGLVVFNATPHVIRFWDPGWDYPVEVEPDTVVNAEVSEVAVGSGGFPGFVRTEFRPTPEGWAILEQAAAAGAVIVGSIIAAQAYPWSRPGNFGLYVCAMTPAPGYERVPPAEKRMRPDKFTVY